MKYVYFFGIFCNVFVFFINMDLHPMQAFISLIVALFLTVLFLMETKTGDKDE